MWYQMLLCHCGCMYEGVLLLGIVKACCGTAKLIVPSQQLSAVTAPLCCSCHTFHSHYTLCCIAQGILLSYSGELRLSC